MVPSAYENRLARKRSASAAPRKRARLAELLLSASTSCQSPTSSGSGSLKPSVARSKSTLRRAIDPIREIEKKARSILR